MGADRPWKSKYVLLTVTAYCPNSCCCGDSADGITATGRNAYRPGVAVDPEIIPLGAHLDIPIYGDMRGWWTLADDVGGRVKGNTIDVRMKTHEEAVQWGRKRLRVRVWSR